MPFYLTPDPYNATRAWPIANADENLVQRFFLPLWMGWPITDEVLKAKPDPLWVEYKSKRTTLPLMFGGDSNPNPWYVDKQVKVALESLEPQRHNFIPINVRRKNSDQSEFEYYILHVTTVVQAVIIDETRFSNGVGRRAYEQAPQLVEYGPIVLDSKKIVGHHLWRGGIGEMGVRVPFFSNYFCSDEFASQIGKLKPIQVKFHNCLAR